ncbi:hypothetical protein [Hasllibacter sp. MH4015]|uniref:hypothetical protein n=1 Tax=Hasllibacter sp. MH4015 TaxID=2854029 RepID=UPI001CD3234F|nr:hypothetical protein [Hasllibacter sp. MH4015]
MSAPDTNIERQTKRHTPSIWGISIALIAAAIAAVFFMMWTGTEGEDQAAPAAVPAVSDQ